MVKEFQIRTKRRKYVFNSANELENFVMQKKKYLIHDSIYFIDENNNVIGILKISSYVKAKK